MKRKPYYHRSKVSIFLLSIALFSCQSAEESAENAPSQKSDATTLPLSLGNKVENDKFYGTVYQSILGKIGTQTSFVTFEPGGRTNWHLHPGGQTLIVTDGVGYYQEAGKPIQIIRKGDVVNIEKEVKHWHGASASCKMSHIAISIDHEAHPSEWFEVVSEEDYNSVAPPDCE